MLYSCTHRDILRKKISLVRVGIPKISNHIYVNYSSGKSLRPAELRQTYRRMCLQKNSYVGDESRETLNSDENAAKEYSTRVGWPVGL